MFVFYYVSFDFIYLFIYILLFLLKVIMCSCCIVINNTVLQAFLSPLCLQHRGGSDEPCLTVTRDYIKISFYLYTF